MTRIELDGHDAVGIRADNPGMLTLTGTNTWIVGRDPAWVIDPGPDLASHIDALAHEVSSRGGLGGVALTHSHHDHSEAVDPLLERFPGGVRSPPAVPGPLETLPLPGHSTDHVVYLWDGIAFSGDAVLGEGSVFISPDPGSLAGYLAGLAALAERQPTLIGPGHGPLITDPQGKLSEYIAHRNEREARLLAALAEGRRSVDDLLDAAWSEVPEQLRFPAALTLATHLDKLETEGRLPDGVERPQWPIPGWPQV